MTQHVSILLSLLHIFRYKVSQRKKYKNYVSIKKKAQNVRRSAIQVYGICISKRPRRRLKVGRVRA